MNFQKSYFFYSILALFNMKENQIFNLEDIIFINYVNRNHYQLLKPNNEFILNRIKNINSLEYNLIYFDRKTKQIIDLRNENNRILDNLENEISESEIEIKSQEEKKIKKEDKLIISTTSSNEENKEKKDPKKVILKSLSDKNIKESKITKTEKDEKEDNQLPNIENKEYKNKL